MAQKRQTNSSQASAALEWLKDLSEIPSRAPPWDCHGCTGTATSAVAVPPGSSPTADRAVVISMNPVVLGRNAIGESSPELACAASRSWEHHFGWNSDGKMNIGLAAEAAVAAGGHRNLRQSLALSWPCNSRLCAALCVARCCNLQQ